MPADANKGRVLSQEKSNVTLERRRFIPAPSIRKPRGAGHAPSSIDSQPARRPQRARTFQDLGAFIPDPTQAFQVRP